MADKEFLERIKECVEDQKPAEVEEMDLEDIEIGKLTPAIKKELEKYKNLKILGITNCGLTTLENFPNLNALQELNLSTNNLNGAALAPLAGLKNLKVLSIVENQIKNVEELKSIASLGLAQIDLYDNEITNVDGYQKKVFGVIPSLEFVDGVDKEGNPVEDEDDIEGGDDEEDDEEEPEEDDEEEEEEDPKKKKKTK
eukprot:TRINITY_DN4856_c0_g1_i11.p1 TRINITY_DN4856_c0_g1~~TRINITY_DN4856_c0_g1_i11.p1  ORF type:complete len:198 (+),score=79.12 TRINITY_DN4856_c0_g1_i11:33-626(+)